MIYVLFAFLLALTISFYILFDRNILSPSVIVAAMFSVSTFVCCLNSNNWKFSIQLFTFFLIIACLFSFSMGEFFSCFVFYKKNNRKKIITKKNDAIFSLSKKKIFIISLIFTFLLINYYKEVKELAYKVGYQGIGLWLGYSRNALINGYHVNRIASYSYTFCKIFAYYTVFCCIRNQLFFHKKNTIIFFLPSLIYCFFIILSTGRTDFIYFISYILFLVSFFYLQRNNWNSKCALKVLFLVALGLFSFFIIFIFVGMLKSQEFSEKPFEMISIYTGLSIPSLDNFLNSNFYKSEIFGEHTFLGLYAIVQKINPNISIPSSALEFSYFDGVCGNVYSAIRRYYQDFGFMGCISIMFLLGLFYSSFFNLIKKDDSLSVLLYASIFYPLVEFSIEERFFMYVLSFPTMQFIFFISLIFYLKKKGRKFINYLFAYRRRY